MQGSSWILTRGVPADARVRLFCLPFAGGGASAYASWGAVLGSTVHVVPIQLPGRENRLREPPLRDLPTLAREVIAATAPLCDRPYALFGHSMGALLAFEIARELRRRELPPPQLLFASAKRAPHLGPDPSPLGRLPDDALLASLQQAFGLELSDEMRPIVELMLPTIRADILAVDDYRYVEEPPFAFPIAAVGGESDRAVRVDELDAWRVHTREAFTLQQFPGGHLFLQGARERLVPWIGRELGRL